MNKRSKDYIPYDFEIAEARAAAAERIKDKPDPRHVYIATYTVNGAECSEEVMAYNSKEAEEDLKQQLGMVGYVPANLKLVMKEDVK